MRLLELLTESPTDDAAYAKMANRAWVMVAKMIDQGQVVTMRADIDQDGVEEMVEWVPVSRLRGEDALMASLPANFPNLGDWIVAFNPTFRINARGFFTRVNLLGRGPTYIIAMKMEPKHLETLQGRETFRHEFIHMCDQLRLKNPDYVAQYDVGKIGTPAGDQAYFSNPFEFNAHFHDFSEGIASFIAELPDYDNVDDVRALQDMYLGDSLMSYFRKQARKSVKFKRLLANMTLPYRQKFMKRFAKLYRAAEEAAVTRIRELETPATEKH